MGDMIMADCNTNNIQHGRTIDDILEQKLCELSEKKLTEDVLIPLFKSFGYFKVDYHGGPYEKGKDLICLKIDEIGEVELSVVQVKLYKPSAKAADTKSFTEIINQLRVASETPVPHTDGKEYIPSTTYFVTPYNISTRSLDSRFKGFSDMKYRRIKIIDGSILVNYLKNKLPDIVNRLIGDDILIKNHINTELLNKELFSALNIDHLKGADEYYIDLEFGVGDWTTKFFFSVSLEPSEVDVEYSIEQYDRLKKAEKAANSFFNKSILGETLSDIEKKYKIKEQLYSIEKQSLSDIEKEIKHIKEGALQFESLFQNANTFFKASISEPKFPESKRKFIRKNILNRFNVINEKIINIKDKMGEDKIDNSIEDFEKTLLKKLEELLPVVETFMEDIKEEDLALQNPIEESQKIKIDTQVISKLLHSSENYFSIIKKLTQLSHKINFIKERLKKPLYYKFTIYGEDLANEIRNRQKWLSDFIDRINNNEVDKKELRAFLMECYSLFNATDKIFKDSNVRKALGVPVEQVFSLKNIENRVSVPLQNILDTGLNIALLGEAGAGKTTSLKKYSNIRRSYALKTEIVMFVPLVQLVNNYYKKYSKEDVDNHPPLKQLKRALYEYLKSSGLSITYDDLMKLLDNRKVIYIFDGIDEISVRTTWILPAIDELSTTHERSQIIVSSRLSEIILRELRFLTVTLLPFSDSQRESFISMWFKGKKKISKRIIKHIDDNKELGKLVRNPLLTTILCVLEENIIPLPENEIRLYEERFRLLMGHYDIHKKSVRIKSQLSDLDRVARKIAYVFHKSRLRFEYPEKIKEIMNKEFLDLIDKDRISCAIDELIDPCNILVPMTEFGDIGFGHLRYQEFMAACELSRNRSIAIRPLLYNAWWYETLLLFTKLIDDIKPIVIEITRYTNLDSANKLLSQMIKTRPKKEQDELNSLIEESCRNYTRDLDYYDIGLDLSGLDIDLLIGDLEL